MVSRLRPKLTLPKQNRFNSPTRLTINRNRNRLPFDYPVEYIRQELEDKYTTRVAQGGLSVYTTINVEAQKKAYEVVRAGLRRYDKSHAAGARVTQSIPTAANNGAGPPTAAGTRQLQTSGLVWQRLSGGPLPDRAWS